LGGSRRLSYLAVEGKQPGAVAEHQCLENAHLRCTAS
jgi:hypothetical protein